VSGGTICRRRERKEELAGESRSKHQSEREQIKYLKYAETVIDGVDRPDLIFTNQGLSVGLSLSVYLSNGS
jgi:hypothetical protein